MSRTSDRFSLMTKKRAVLPIIASVLLFGAAACSQNEEPAAQESSSASTESSSSKETKKPEPTRGEVAKPEETQAAAATTGECAAAAVRKNPENHWVDNIENCDGKFLFGGQAQTDHVGLFRFADGQWKRIPHAPGKTTHTGFPCYETSTLDELGVPQATRARVSKCDGSSSTGGQSNGSNSSGYLTSAALGEWVEPAAQPACDGRNILIVNSVHVPGNDRSELNDQIAMTIARGNNLDFTTPGKCPSLRSQINGEDIYPIYYDFGQDQQAMCAAKAREGGNARTLNTAGDFTDPC